MLKIENEFIGVAGIADAAEYIGAGALEAEGAGSAQLDRAVDTRVGRNGPVLTPKRCCGSGCWSPKSLSL